MPAFRWSELKEEGVEPEYSAARAAVVRGQKIAVSRSVYPAATEVKPHATPNEQIHAILKGKAKYGVGGEERVVGPGEAVLIRPNTDYAVQILEDLELVTFTDVAPGAGARPEGGKGTAFFEWGEMKADFITPKYSSGRGPTITGERIEVAFMFYPAGTEAKRHSHPNEQIQVALRGRAKYGIGADEILTGPGEGVLMPVNVEHGVQILEDYTVLNCKDIVPGWSVYHARWEK